ncbi:MAG: RNB domain-containing ribonuclease [Cocleimonas sp.]
MSELKSGALVYYKSKAAIIETVSDKIEISFFKTIKRVRTKDIKLIHPGPIKDVSTLDMDIPESLATLEETLELLEDEIITLAELSDFLFNEFTPQSAWSSWMLVTDGIYFELIDDINGSETDIGKIKARPQKLILADIEKRNARQQQQESWDSLIDRIKKGKIEKTDYNHLTEVEQVACGEHDNSRILKAIGTQENKEAAHTLLLKLGYWKDDYNPWPRRMGIVMGDPELTIPEPLETKRANLQHLQAWAIDDVGNQDPDDAISTDGDFLWVHIADVSSIVTPESELDIEARSRGTNVYLPDQTIHMLPTAITEKLGLGLQTQSHALSIGFRITERGELEDIEICFSDIKVTRTTYGEADQQLDSTFSDLKSITDRYHRRRIDNDAAMLDLPEVNIKVDQGKISIHPYSRGGSRQLVTEAMLAAGEAVATFATQNNIPIPYAGQIEPEKIHHPQKLSEHYAYRRCFKASRHTTSPEAHFGLGLPAYTRVTSPMRRYLDLIVHQQIRAFLNGQEMLGHEALVERIGLADEGSFAARKAERNSNQHWKMLYLQQESKGDKNWQGEAIVVTQEGRNTSVILPDIALEPKLRKRDDLELDQAVTVEMQTVNIPDLRASFKIL